MPVSSCHLAAVALVAAALALSGCGRKGPLDAPPGGLAAAPGSEASAAEEAGELVRRGSARGLPVIRGPNKRIPLDALLD